MKLGHGTVLVWVTLVCCFDVHVANCDDAITVANGFSWAENIVCDPSTPNHMSNTNGTLWVAENTRGELWAVSVNATTNLWFQTRHVSQNISKVCGLALSARSGTLYALFQPTKGSCTVVVVDKTKPETITRVVAVLPRACLGDGLALDDASGMLYIANEGDFVPGQGRVYAINISSGNVTTLVKSGVTGTDGAFFEPITKTLFVSEVTTSTLLQIDPISGHIQTRFKGPSGVLGIDDFHVMRSGLHTIVHASSFFNGKAFRWNLTDDSTRFFGSDLKSPTSVRRGCATLGVGGWFVTEGGGATKATTNRRTLFYPLMD